MLRELRNQAVWFLGVYFTVSVLLYVLIAGHNPAALTTPWFMFTVPSYVLTWGPAALALVLLTRGLVGSDERLKIEGKRLSGFEFGTMLGVGCMVALIILQPLLQYEGGVPNGFRDRAWYLYLVVVWLSFLALMSTWAAVQQRVRPSRPYLRGGKLVTHRSEYWRPLWTGKKHKVEALPKTISVDCRWVPRPFTEDEIHVRADWYVCFGEAGLSAGTEVNKGVLTLVATQLLQKRLHELEQPDALSDLRKIFVLDGFSNVTLSFP